MQKYLIDNSVLHGYANTEDCHHKACTDFVQKHDNELVFLVHTLFEFKASREHRLLQGTFTGLLGGHQWKNIPLVETSQKLFNDLQNQNIFIKFKKLKGADLLYACVTDISNYTLVTCDSHFNAYKDVIGLIQLNKTCIKQI